MVTEDAGYRWQPERASTLAVAGVCSSPTACVAVGTNGLIETSASVFTLAAFPVPKGYRLAATDGGVFSFRAPYYGSMGGTHLNKPVIGMATDPATDGYWLVASDGGIFAFHASFYGSMGEQRLNQPIVAMAADPTGDGYWLLASDGGIFTFGNAKYLGSAVGKIGSARAVGIAPSNGPDGGYLVLTTTGFLEFGALSWAGCESGTIPPRAVGIASSIPIGPAPVIDVCPFLATAYAASAAGAVAALDSAPPHGGVGSPPSPIVAIATDPTNQFSPPAEGYWLVDTKGGVFNLDAPYLGSMAGKALAAPIVAIAPG
jgi:hypothetical protein